MSGASQARFHPQQSSTHSSCQDAIRSYPLPRVVEQLILVDNGGTGYRVAGADDGVNHLSMRLNDTGRSLKLFEEFIPCSLFMSPGRTRTTGIAGDPSHQLFFPIEFDYTFIPNSTIQR